jgi:DNA-binding SARP family transcriptional activator/TolB-like protein
MFTLRLFGGALLEGPGGPLGGRVAQRRRLALLAVLVLARDRPVSRDRLLGLFWPESDAERARHSLADSLYQIRRELGEAAVLTSGDDVMLNAERVRSDVAAFEAALAHGDAEAAVQRYAGPLLEGFFVEGAPEFERLVERERDRLASLHAQALEALAVAAEQRADHTAAAEWWKARAAQDPYDSRIVLRLMRALEAGGNRAAALRQAAVHGALLRDELGMEPDSEVAALAERLRRAPEPVAARPDPPPRAAALAAGDGAGDAPAVGQGRSPDSAAARTDSAGWRRHARGLAVAGALGLAFTTGAYLAFGNRPGTADPPPEIRSLAVLPLANLSADPGQDYFTDAMHDALIAELGKIGALKVISRTSAMQYKQTDKRLPQIARELGVDGLVEGSVLRAGERVRVTVQLLHGPTDRHLWAESYERDIRDVLALQAEVARAIAASVRARLSAGEEARLTGARPVDPAAHEAWLRGWAARLRSTPEGIEECLRYGDQALALDPGFARAHVLLAVCHNSATYQALAPPAESFARAREAALRAIELDPTLAEAHAELAWALATRDWDWAAAEGGFRRALELNPNLVWGRGYYAFFLAWLGRHEEAMREIRLAEQLDPLAPGLAQLAAVVLLLGRRYDDAIAHAQRAIRMTPASPFAHLRLGQAYASMGRYAEATAAFEEAYRLSPDPRRKAFVGRAHALAGRTHEAREILAELLAHQRETYVPPVGIAAVYTGLGETDEAIAWLQKGFDERDGDMVLLKTWPVWDPLRSDPRFQEMLRRMRFPET